MIFFCQNVTFVKIVVTQYNSENHVVDLNMHSIDLLLSFLTTIVSILIVILVFFSHVGIQTLIFNSYNPLA